MTIPFCDTPGQSLVVGVVVGVSTGLAGDATELEVAAVVALAGGVAMAADLGLHVLRRDQQFVAATRRLRG